MSRLIYAQAGSSHARSGGACPPGWIVMQGERPTPEHVAQEDGSWGLPPPVVPSVVTMRQARQAMLNAGILGQVDSLIAAMPGDEGESARIDWAYAHDVKRDWPLIGALGPQVGLNEQQIDDLFIYAATIPQ